MVSRSYMSLDERPPSRAKTAFDQTFMPMLIDVAGDLEAMIERLATPARRSPGRALVAAFALGTVASLMLVRRR